MHWLSSSIAAMVLNGSLLSMAAAQPTHEPQTSKEDTCEKYCSRGVKGMTPGAGLEIGVETLPGLNFRGANGKKHSLRQHRRMYAQVRFPVVLQPSLKILGGLSMSRQVFDFKNNPQSEALPEALNTRSLKASEFTLYAIKALNSKIYLGTKATIGFNGDYRGPFNISSNQMNTALATLVGFKVSNDTEYGIGAIQSYWNNDYGIFPVLQYNKTFHDWGIEALLPAKFYLRHNFSAHRVAYIGAEYYGREYRLNGNYGLPEGDAFRYDNNALRFQVNFEQRLFPWVWLNAKVGYQTSLNFRFQAAKQAPFSATNQPSGIYTGMAFSIRPPD